MRFARGDVRDHIVLAGIDHRPSYRRYSALQQRESPKINFREIFEVVRFSTFATVSANSGNRVDYDRSGSNAAARGKITRISANSPGSVSTSIEPPGATRAWLDEMQVRQA
jgi:hypothetical protein